MIEKLAELNRVLLAVDELCDVNRTAQIDAVIDRCKSTVIEARIPKHEVSISFAQQVGLLQAEGTEIQLTDDGDSFIKLNPTSQYDLSDEQKKVLLRTCYLHGPLRQEARSILKEFSPALEGESLRWSSFDSSPLQNEWAAEHLNQLGLLERTDDGWEVRAVYAKTVAIFLEEGDGWSEEKFREYLKEKEEVGNLGESLVRGYETRRLLSLGHAVEARCVRRISNVRVNAGYDIDSFDGPSPAVVYDRFIEVKGARARKIRFFWSDNEMNVAKKLGKNYWIYFQGSIDVAKGIARDEPVMIQDPWSFILGNSRFKTVPQGLIVESDLKGNPIEQQL
ncbi:MAG: DUF3883 domain-containing protein [Acidobacteriia bacterium]|nr:DUF3883 domain-containing protein [Terriglobia bacterium]